ncbi:hypothetical protein [Labrys sp. 22185]|uniref:hypothetical protein n=1 Tax=Labrys sp. 22185 TaxID=3453888 RepID=UPI003F82EBFF
MRKLCLLIGVSVASAFVATAIAAPAKEQRLLAHTVDISGKDPKNVQLQIWADRLPQLKKAREVVLSAQPSAGFVAEFFSTAFESPKGRIIVSVVNDQCSTSSATQNDLYCPARIVLDKGGKLQLLKQVDDFDVHMVRGEQGYDTSSNNSKTDATLVSFDPASMQMKVRTFADGRAEADAVNYSLN